VEGDQKRHAAFQPHNRRVIDARQFSQLPDRQSLPFPLHPQPVAQGRPLRCLCHTCSPFMTCLLWGGGSKNTMARSIRHTLHHVKNKKVTTWAGEKSPYYGEKSAPPTQRQWDL